MKNLANKQCSLLDIERSKALVQKINLCVRFSGRVVETTIKDEQGIAILE